MKKTLHISIALLILIPSTVLFVVPAQTARAADTPKLDYSGFVKCDGVVKKQYDAKGKATGKVDPAESDRDRVCDFAALMDTALGLVTWMFRISVAAATVLFAYAGVLYMSGKEKNISTAKAIFTSVAVGFIIMLVAWISVKTFVDWFVDKDSGATTFIQ
jgi:hypothetical protein